MYIYIYHVYIYIYYKYKVSAAARAIHPAPLSNQTLAAIGELAAGIALVPLALYQSCAGW